MMKKTPSRQLAAFIAKFTPDIARQTRAVLAVMRKRLPGALELVYDNYNALAIGFSPTDRAGQVIFSIAVFPRWLSLFLFRAPKLPDPTKRLRGGGATTRHIVLENGARTLDEPDVKALMRAALAQVRPALDPAQEHRIIIKAIVAKQRPRRPSAPTHLPRRASR